MLTALNARLVSSFRSFSGVASLSAILVGALVLLGWGLDIAALKSVLPGLVTMKVNTALGFLLAGICLWLLQPGPAEPEYRSWRRRTGQAGAGAIALLGLLSLSQYLFGWNLRIDELLFRDVAGAVGTSHPGRMAPATAITFLLLGCALLLLDVQGRRGRRPAQYLALAAACVAFVASLGYTYDIRSLYGLASYTEMALHTALTFLLLSAGLLCARPDRGLMAIVTSQGAGGVLARRLLPAAIGIPAILGWLRLKGQQAGLYGTELGTALFVLSSIIGFTVVIYLYAGSLDRADGVREQAEAALRKAHEELEIRVQERTAELLRVNEGLQTEIVARKQAEEALRAAHDELETRVRERTAELARTNQTLQAEITERVRAQEDLDHYFTLSLDLLCIAGFDGYFKRINPAWERVLDWGREELLARPFLDFVHPEDREATVAETQNLSTGKDTISFENRYLSKDGRYRWLSWNATPLPARQMIYAAARDVTERKEAEEEIRKLNEDLERHAADLAAANKELEAFTYSVSHDLRAPLRQIDGFSKLLVEEHGQGLSAGARHYLERVSEGTRQMGRLVDDLLNLARLGRQEVRRQVTGLNSLVREVLEDLKGEMSDRPIKFEIGQLPFVECDPALMKQVFANLLSNALKFTRSREPAVIQVDRTTCDSQPAVFIRDNGVGFSMKYADKLFGVFQRLHRVEDFEGTGVGLATVQRIIHKHGGRVWAEAELDKGATFYFTLGIAENNTREIGERKNDARVVAGGER